MVRAWEAQGHRVDVLGPPGVSLEEKADRNNTGILRGIYVSLSRIAPELVFELLELAYNIIAAWNIRQALANRRYDFIYSRYAIFDWAGVWLARTMKIPILLEVNYTAKTPLYRKRSRLLKSIAVKVDRYVFDNADGIIVVSSYLREHLADAYGVRKTKIIVLPNAADPVRFSADTRTGAIKARLGLESKTVVGFVGGFYPWHGLPFFCSTLSLMRLDRPDVFFLFIGNGPQRDTIKELMAKNGLGGRAMFIDYVDHFDLPEYLSAIDIAVLPDSNEYGSPMKVFEYMAMGIPVVAPRLGPIRDAIDDGIEGLLFEPGSSRSFAEALQKMLDDGVLRTRLGKAARARVVSRHNWMANATEVIRLYETKRRLNVLLKG